MTHAVTLGSKRCIESLSSVICRHVVRERFRDHAISVRIALVSGQITLESTNVEREEKRKKC